MGRLGTVTEDRVPQVVRPGHVRGGGMVASDDDSFGIAGAEPDAASPDNPSPSFPDRREKLAAYLRPDHRVRLVGHILRDVHPVRLQEAESMTVIAVRTGSAAARAGI